jgi:glycyl-tRNA synthetase alpha subunit
MKNSAKTFFSIFSSLFVLFLVVLVYNSYVIHQPCKHDLKIIDLTNKIRVTANSSYVHRLQKALKFKTISYEHGRQNLEEFKEYIKFIQSGN